MVGLNLSSIILDILILTPGFLLAITVHEFAHGYVAYRFGDNTAKAQGRLTFNPLSHLDPVGTLMLVLTRMIGWAKPVPIDARNLRNPRTDMLWISLAGPAANLITAIVLALVFHIIIFATAGGVTSELTFSILDPVVRILYRGVLINVVLAVFNMIPVPPLDGSKILASILPREQAYQFERLGRYGILILMILIVTQVINYVITPPIKFIFNLLMAGVI